MPNGLFTMSPFLSKATGRPSNDAFLLIFVFRICARTSARLAVPFAQARSIAPATTCAAT